jgi:hypothetical protein
MDRAGARARARARARLIARARRWGVRARFGRWYLVRLTAQGRFRGDIWVADLNMATARYFGAWLRNAMGEGGGSLVLRREVLFR